MRRQLKLGFWIFLSWLSTSPSLWALAARPQGNGNLVRNALAQKNPDEPSSVTNEPLEIPAPLSEEVRLMQEIEPGFVPSDRRTNEIFKLQNDTAKNDDIFRIKVEEKEKGRAQISQRIRDELFSLANKKSEGLDTRIDGMIDEVIKHYERALSDYPDYPQYSARALYNLGRYYFERDEKNYFEKLRQYSEAKEKGLEDQPYPEEDFNRTIDTYETLIKKHPNFEKMVSVYYLLGLALWYEGAFYNAVDRFEELLKKFPDSRLVEEVWFRLGEFFYDMDEFEDAIRAYSKVIANEKSTFYDKAVYKIAWAHFQKDRFMLSVENFVKVIELTYAGAEDSVASGMRAEALKYVVKNFSEQLLIEQSRKGVRILSKAAEKEYSEKLGIMLTERISAYFMAAGPPPYYRDILLETASWLLDDAKIDGAILAFEKIKSLDSNHKDNPRIDSQIIEILEEAGRSEDALSRSYSLLETYKKDSPWAVAQKGDRLALKVAREAVRDAMLSLAVQRHKGGKELKEKGDVKGAERNFAEAASLYRKYLEDFPERDDTHKAIFYFAESSFEMNRYRAALDAYSMLKEYPLPMPENFRRDATFNIVFTFRHVLESEAKAGRFKEINFDNLTSKARGLEPEEIPPLGQRYLASIDEFFKIAPEDAQVPILLFHAGAIYYVYGHTDEALKRFFQIIYAHPKSPAASVAARLILDDAVAKENWPRVIDLARRFTSGGLDGNTGDFARLEGNARFKIARAVFDEAASLKSQNQLNEARAKYRESAELFATLLREDPKNPFADIMLFNSARAIEESGTLTEALPLYRRLYTEYPKSEYAKAARFQEALSLEKMLKFPEAAAAYEAIIRLEPYSATAADAMLNKAILYEAAGNFSSAAFAYLDFAKKYPDREEAPLALLSAASLYKKMGKVSEHLAMLERFVRGYNRDRKNINLVIEAHVDIADTYGELEKKATGATLKRYQAARIDNYRRAVALYSADLDSPLAAYLAAKARLSLEKPEQDAFRKMMINAKTGKAQGEQMTSLLKKLTELATKNEAIIKEYAQPVWNAEALRRIGALYEHLARAMVKAPCPRDVAVVDEYACDEYIVLLEDKAAVLEQKAVSAYKQAYEIAQSATDAPLNLMDSILAGLNRLRPGEYQRVGNLIEKPQIGTVYGQGRMLSTGKMSSVLHPEEADPDLVKPVLDKEVKEEQNEEALPPKQDPPAEPDRKDNVDGVKEDVE